MVAPGQSLKDNAIFDDATYLQAPIATLSESTEDALFGHLSTHDLLEAYHILSTRIKTIATALSHDVRDIPAMHDIQQNSAVILSCVRRDIHRAFVNPFSEPSGCNSLVSDSVSFPESEAIEGDLKHGREMSLISQYALRLLSSIYNLPWLPALFPPQDLIDLLDDVAAVAVADSLPTPNNLKTRSLAIWILSNLRLPTALLSPARTVLHSALMQILTQSSVETCIVGCLKALHSLLRTYPSVLLEPFTDMIPIVLSSLSSPSPYVRTQGANALCGYVLALLSAPPPSRERARAIIKHHIHFYIETSSKQPSDAASTPNLQDLVVDALKSGNVSVVGQGLPWAHVVLACIIILSDRDVFTHKHTLRFVMASLGHSARHKTRPFIRALHACTWKCLVWAFARIQSVVDCGRISEDVEDCAVASKTRSRAFLLVKQEFKCGVGLALVSSLLSPSTAAPTQIQMCQARDEDVSKAIEVISVMVQDEDDSEHSEGQAILTWLISSIGARSSVASISTISSSEPQDRILALELFDGTIIKAQEKQLVALVPALGKLTVAEHVRTLTESEVVQHWDELVGLWMLCARRSIIRNPSSSQPDDNALKVWQALLLVQIQSTQEYGHLTRPPEIACRAVETIAEILQHKANFTSDNLLRNDIQYPLLILVRQLWAVMSTFFDTSWLASAAGTILTVVLKQHYDLARIEVKTVWGELCAALIASNSPDFICKLATRTEEVEEIQVKRHLWSILAESWGSYDSKQGWPHSLAFLAVPLALWDMSHEEMDVWDQILTVTVSRADATSASSSVILESLGSCISEQSKRLSAHPGIALSLLSHWRPQFEDTIPTTFLLLINEFLHDTYDSLRQLLYPTLDVFRLLTNVIKSCPNASLVSIVTALSDGLCIWVGDQKEVLLQEEYNGVVMSLYQNTLQRLRGVSITHETLEVLAPFLRSGFGRIPPPALGPAAFKEFWEHIYPGLTPDRPLPTCIQQIVIPCYQLFGGTPPCNIIIDLDSQSQSQLQEEGIVRDTLQSQDDLAHLHLPHSHKDENVSRENSSSRLETPETQESQDLSTDSYRSSETRERPGNNAMILQTNDVASYEITTMRAPLSAVRSRLQVAEEEDLPEAVGGRNSGVIRLQSGRTRDTSDSIAVGMKIHSGSHERPAQNDSPPATDPSFSFFSHSSPTAEKRVFRGHDHPIGSDHDGYRKPPKRPRAGPSLVAVRHSRSSARSGSHDCDNSTESKAPRSAPIDVSKTSRGTSECKSSIGKSWKFDGIELPRYVEVKRRRSEAKRTPPMRRSSPRYNRSVTSEVRLSATTISLGDPSSATRSSDDYTIWETHVNPQDVFQLQSELDGDEDMRAEERSSSPLGEELLSTPIRRGDVQLHASPDPNYTFVLSSQNDAEDATSSGDTSSVIFD